MYQSVDRGYSRDVDPDRARHCKGILRFPLRELGMDPARLADKHDEITKEHGPYTAACEHCVRTLHISKPKGRQVASVRRPAVTGDDCVNR